MTHAQIISAFARLMTDPELPAPILDRSQPPTAIIDIREVDCDVIRHKYGAEHVYEVMLNDFSFHYVAYRGDDERTSCLTHGEFFCPASARVILYRIHQQRAH